MNTKSIYKLIFIAILSSQYMQSAYADIAYTEDKIKSISVYFGRIIVETVSAHNKTCGDGSNDKNSFELSKDNADFKEIYSALLTAKTAGNNILLLSDTVVCREWWGIKRPELISVTIK